MAKAIAGTLVKQECSLEPCKVVPCGIGGSPFGEPGFTCRVIALEEIDWVWVTPRVLSFKVVQVASHHCDELHGILQRVDADE